MIIGIDLGTTNSLAAYWRDGEARLIPNSHGGVLTPSVVGFGDKGELLVGESARRRLITHPQATTASFKRYMGTDKKIFLGSESFRVEELSSFILKSLNQSGKVLFYFRVLLGLFFFVT